MQKTQDTANLVNTLLEMGYSRDMISLAMKDTKKKTLEKILDLLATNDAAYKAILATPNPSEEVSDDSDQDQGKYRRKNSSKKDQQKKAQKKNSAQFKDEKRPTRKDTESDNSDNDYGDDNDGDVPKYLDEEALEYVESAIQAFNFFKTHKAKDSNWYIVELEDQLKSLKFRTSEGAKRMRYYLDCGGHYPKLIEFKKLVYQIINRVLDTKVNKKFRTNFTGFEEILTIAFELNIFSPKQMEKVLTLYPKLCGKHMHRFSEEWLEELDNIYKAAKDQGNGIDNDDQDENILGDDEPEEAKADEDTNEAANEVVNEAPAELINIDDKEKEYCIICVQKVREIVFMPCCHFLTCRLCSTKIGKCPVCNNKVHKHLQIYWS